MTDASRQDGLLPDGNVLENDWQEIAGRYLPSDPGSGIWRMSRGGLSGLPRQGWKLHISATVLNACQVLSATGPILEESNAIFKGIRSIAELRKLNCGLFYGYSQIGKFLTVYPGSPGSTIDIAEKICGVLAGQHGPAVPFETRVRADCPVYARYGSFTSQLSERSLLVAPDGSEVSDRRDKNPDWATPPEGLFTEKLPSASGLLARSYKAYGFISQRGKGGVYRALDMTRFPPRHCVLKEGRRHGEVDLDGGDGYSRVTEELTTANYLRSIGIPLPEIYSSFDEAGNKYIVLEWMPGGSLAETLHLLRENLPIVGALWFAAQAADLVAQIHASGWIWRDVKPANFLVDGSKRLRPIDFEGSLQIGAESPFPWGSPGYVPPEWHENGRASAAQDCYALGVTLRQILSDRPEDVGSFRPGIPDPVKALVQNLTDGSPGNRPSAREAASIVAAFAEEYA